MIDKVTAALADQYRVLRELGSGGMATVYLAEDIKHRRRVAVKVLRPDLAASLGRERFFREIEVAARLQHPHILPLHDSGEAGGFLYYVMPYVEGTSLRDRLSQGGELPVGEVVRIIAEVADALAYAHKHGVVHRDIKPDNVMLSGRHALVMDFGIAKAVSEATGPSSITSVGIALGTPAYMAPEQAMAEGQIDQRADIYALGVVAYELLTGRPPFVGASPQQVLAAHVTQAPDHVTQRRTTCPPALASVVMRCLEKRAADRFQQAEEISHQLDNILTPSGGHAPTTATPGYRPARKWWGPFVAAIVLLAAVGVGIQWWKRAHAGSAAAAAADNSHRIAVLPFENLGDSTRTYFANGVTEAITSQLTSIGDLSVIPRTTAAKYRGSPKSVSEIARELGVGYVLTGTVQWDEAPGREARVRVSPELIRVSDTSSVWAHGYDAVLTSVFDVYSDVSNQVATALAVALNDPQKAALARRPTQNAQAYDNYLRAIDYANRGLARENNEASIEMLQRAVALDSTFALAWGRLAEQLGLVHWLYLRRTDETLAQAQAAAERALALQPDLPEAHRAMGSVWYRKREYDKALAEFAIVERSQPNSADLMSAIGFVERRLGKWDAAIQHLSRARDLDPGSANTLSQLGETYSIVHRYDEAATQFRRAIEIAPDQPDAYYFLALMRVSQSGDTAGALAILQDGATRMPAVRLLVGTIRQFAFAIAPDSVLSHAIATTAAADPGGASVQRSVFLADLRLLRGDAAGARARYDSIRTTLRQLLATTPNDYGYQAYLGRVAARLGEAAEAIRAGKRAIELLPPEKDAYFGVDNVLSLAGDYAILGQAAPAVEQLRRALAYPTVVTRAMLRVDPTFDPIRADPAFKAFMAEGR
jgi:serine/threonine-protein kinase